MSTKPLFAIAWFSYRYAILNAVVLIINIVLNLLQWYREGSESVLVWVNERDFFLLFFINFTFLLGILFEYLLLRYRKKPMDPAKAIDRFFFGCLVVCGLLAVGLILKDLVAIF